MALSNVISSQSYYTLKINFDTYNDHRFYIIFTILVLHISFLVITIFISVESDFIFFLRVNLKTIHTL